MSDFNFDENTINKVKNMMDNGELSDVMSKISPEMIQNFSSMLNSNNVTGSNGNTNNSGYSENIERNGNFNPSNNSSQHHNSNNQTGFDFSNIDMNTIMKMKSVMEKMNNKNDPRANLLNSLKPYLREEKRGKLDQYANLMNVAKIAEILKNDEKGSK